MFYASMSALLSHWRRRPMQLAMLLMGLSLATALWSGVQAINAEARASYNRAASMLGQDRLEQLVSADGATIPQQVFVDLSRAGWRVSPVLEGQLRLGAARLHVLGIDPVGSVANYSPSQRSSLSSGKIMRRGFRIARRETGSD